jgi:hypothetical protein
MLLFLFFDILASSDEEENLFPSSPFLLFFPLRKEFRTFSPKFEERTHPADPGSAIIINPSYSK